MAAAPLGTRIRSILKWDSLSKKRAMIKKHRSSHSSSSSLSLSLSSVSVSFLRRFSSSSTATATAAGKTKKKSLLFRAVKWTTGTAITGLGLYAAGAGLALNNESFKKDVWMANKQVTGGQEGLEAVQAVYTKLIDPGKLATETQQKANDLIDNGKKRVESVQKSVSGAVEDVENAYNTTKASVLDSYNSAVDSVDKAKNWVSISPFKHH
jgi:polyhydroxyalkanoate synthesis regulator phasin